MAFKQKLAKATGIPAAKLPSSYQIVGDVLLIKLPKLTASQKQKIGRAILGMLPYIKTVCEIKEISGELREPNISVIAGNGTATVHRENDVLYKLDVSKVMFSKGNLSERKRLLDKIKDGETVIDMFAGIGYFSLPIAKFTKAKEVISIEKNATAYNFLTDNIALNKLNNVIAIQGDCITAARSFPSKADRVLMGYFPGTEKFLGAALWMSKPGCVVHYHNVYSEKELWKKPLGEIEELCKAFRKEYHIECKKKVKSFSPKKWHVVVDFTV